MFQDVAGGQEDGEEKVDTAILLGVVFQFQFQFENISGGACGAGLVKDVS